MELASRSARLLGQIVDGIVAVLPFVPAMGFVFIDELLGGFAIISAVLVAIAYIFLADALPGGQSVGKRMMGIAVVDRHSLVPCSVGQAFVRNILLAILGIFDWVFILGGERRRLGDMAAGTIVVNAPPLHRPGFA